MNLKCSTNCGKRPVLKRPKTGDILCKECFFWAFEEEIHYTITSAGLFSPGDYVAIAASGGKDSTVLIHTLKLLNDRYNYGVKFVLLSIDEGITGYRDDSLETVKRNEECYGIPLKILSYEDLYGWTMDRIVNQIGKTNNCTFCGVFRRQALDRGAALLKVDKIVTGHNADDIAETVIMNLLRGDIARLQRCTSIETGSHGSISRCKPFKYTYEKEIVMYAHFKQLDYFSTECIYSPNAYRGHARAYLKDLERIRPSSIIDIIHSGECISVRDGITLPTQTTCSRCGYVSSQEICKACVLLEGLNKGKSKLAIGKSSKMKVQLLESDSSKSPPPKNKSPSPTSIVQDESSSPRSDEIHLSPGNDTRENCSSGSAVSDSNKDQSLVVWGFDLENVFNDKTKEPEISVSSCEGCSCSKKAGSSSSPRIVELEELLKDVSVTNNSVNSCILKGN